MSKLNPTVEEYRAHIHAHDDYLLDFVATQEEWKRFKEAVELWRSTKVADRSVANPGI
jgi:hypothetical protein